MNQVIVTTPDQLRDMIGEAVRDAIQEVKRPEAWLPVATVAERLGVSPKTVRNWIADGRFTRYSGGDGKPYLVSSVEVDELSRSANSAPDAS